MKISIIIIITIIINVISMIIIIEQQKTIIIIHRTVERQGDMPLNLKGQDEKNVKQPPCP